MYVAIIAGIMAWLGGSKTGYTTLSYCDTTPLIISLVLGIAMGDVPTAMVAGATIQAIYMGVIAPGSNAPSDGGLATYITVPICVQAGLDPSSAIALAIPISILGVSLLQLKQIINGVWARMADKYADQGDINGLVRAAAVYPMFTSLFTRGIPVFLGIYFGTAAVQGVLDFIPEWLSHGLSVSAGLLPALGIGVTLFAIGRKKLLPYFIIGFFLVEYFGISTMGAAVFAISIAVLIMFASMSDSDEPELLLTENASGDRDEKPDSLLSKADITKLFLRWHTWAQTAVSYERLQGVGFSMAFVPILKKLYGHSPEKLKAALKRSLAYFNTQAIWGSPILGIVASMEESFSQQDSISEEEVSSAISGVKIGFMGPLAGIGDAIDWSTLRYIFIGIALGFAFEGSALGGIIPFGFSVVTIAEGLFLTHLGYRMGRNSVQVLLGGKTVKNIITACSIVGLFMMGSLAAQYVKLTTPFAFDISGKAFVIQEVLDKIIPKLLPLLAVFGVYWVMEKKTQKVAVISVSIVVISIIGSIIGIL